MPQTTACPDFHAATRTSRRRALVAGSLALAGIDLAAFLQLAVARSNRTPRARHVIFLHQWGGPSHLDTFDIKPLAPDGMRSVFQPIPSSVPGVPIVEHLPRFATVLDRFAQIRSVHHSITNHNPAGYYALSGHAPPSNDQRLPAGPDLRPGLGAIAARFRPPANPAVPPWVALPHSISDVTTTPGQGGGFLGKAFDPLLLDQNPNRPAFRVPELALPDGISPGRLADRQSLLAQIDAQTRALDADQLGLDPFHRRAADLLAAPAVQRAFDLAREDPRLRDAYGRTTYGQSCLLARRLIEAGVRFVTVQFSRYIGGGGDNGGWDTHGHNTPQLRDKLLPVTDQTVPTLILDLEARGLLAETLVVWMGEFGRTPRITNTAQFGPDGRDHWPRCFTALLAGAGVHGGAVWGASDRLGAYPASDPVKPEDIAATILWALGIDPSTEIQDKLARPLPAAAGFPITQLFT
jgi:hypothetical protein